MVPLTSSLYVPGVMEDNEQVLVEVGAGYFVEKSSEKAKEYCEKKVKMLKPWRKSKAYSLQQSLFLRKKSLEITSRRRNFENIQEIFEYNVLFLL